jgi:hypothetical protein
LLQEEICTLHDSRRAVCVYLLETTNIPSLWYASQAARMSGASFCDKPKVTLHELMNTPQADTDDGEMILRDHIGSLIQACGFSREQ